MLMLVRNYGNFIFEITEALNLRISDPGILFKQQAKLNKIK